MSDILMLILIVKCRNCLQIFCFVPHFSAVSVQADVVDSCSTFDQRFLPISTVVHSLCCRCCGCCIRHYCCCCCCCYCRRSSGSGLVVDRCMQHASSRGRWSAARGLCWRDEQKDRQRKLQHQIHHGWRFVLGYCSLACRCAILKTDSTEFQCNDFRLIHRPLFTDCFMKIFMKQSVNESLMAKWLEQVSQWHEMYCHDLEVMNSNPSGVELGVRSTSVLSHTWTKNKLR